MCCSLCSMHQARKPRSFCGVVLITDFPTLRKFFTMCSVILPLKIYSVWSVEMLRLLWVEDVNSYPAGAGTCPQLGSVSPVPSTQRLRCSRLPRCRRGSYVPRGGPDRFKSHSSMSSWQGVKLFYMHFAQMEMSMESVGGCQRGSSRRSLSVSLLLSRQP